MQPSTNVLPFRTPTHLGEFNEQLHAIQLPRLNGEPALRALLAHANKDLLVRSLFAASSTGHRDAPRCRSFLLNAVNAANQSVAQSAQPATPERNEAPRQSQRPNQQRNSDESGARQSEARGPSHGGGDRRPNPNRGREPDQGRGNQSRPPQNGSGRRDREYAQQAKAFGGKAALCVEADAARFRDTPTVRFELALAVAEKEYDWGNKLSIQVTRTELPNVCAVFLGMLPRYEMKNHGPDSSKWLSMEHQGAVIFVKGGAKDAGIRALPIGAGDATYIAALMLTQLQAALGGLAMPGVLMIVRNVAAAMTAEGAARGQGGQQRAQR